MTVRVYVSGPYSADPEGCTQAALAAASTLLDLGYAPHVPHLKHQWIRQDPRGYEDWMRVDLAWVEAADVVLRLPGDSPGADREVEHARTQGVPVAFSIPGVIALKLPAVTA